MEAANVYPKLRNIDVFPAEVSGQKVICLRDPMNLAGKILFLPSSAFFIISLFDGQHSVVDIQVEFMRRFGELLYREKIQELIDQMEEVFFLDSERFRESERKIIQAFKDSPTRPAALVGEAYEKDPVKLRKTIEDYFAEPEGPGLAAPGGKPGNLTAAIAPHIDYRRGGPCYAWAHKAIRESPQIDLFVILGTSHSPTKRFFALSRKDFETPWGPVETDRAFLAAIETGLSFDPYEDEFAHKTEHSVELQLIFLGAMRSRKTPFQIVPVLCGSFYEAIQKGISPLELPEVSQFIEALRKAIAGRGEKVCLLASADLAHVGLRFGDSEAPDRFSLELLADQDRRLLEFAERVDAEGFFRSLCRERDCRRVCGLPPIYLLLHAVEAREGKLLKYCQSMDQATQSVVTFASLAFFS